MPIAEINGIQMHFLDEGDGSPLVLLHGLGSSSADWEFQLPALAARHRIIAPCLRGFGQSEKPVGPHSVKTWSEDIVALIRHLRLEDPHLLGFSMGGAIAFQTVVDQPDLARSLIVLNSLPSFELDHWTKHLMVLTRIGMARALGMPALARYVARRMFPAPEQADLKRRMIERHSKNDRDSYVNAVNALAGWSVAHALPDIGTPTLVLAADKDYSGMHEKEAYVARMPNATLIAIENSRHVSHVDQPEILNRSVLEFLRELDRDKL